MRANDVIEGIILKSRYLLVPLLCALLFVILTITFDFLLVLIGSSTAASLNEHTLVALELLDITMIANLIWLISAGSYYVFVGSGDSKFERPRCLTHVSAGLLKEKMAGSLIGVSSVHLLQLFLHLSEESGAIDWLRMIILLSVHLTFIIGLVAFNYTNRERDEVNKLAH